MPRKSAVTVYTIGHSTRPVEDLIAMLRAHDVARLIDARTVPRSRHNPQFDRESLPATLAAAGIAYAHVPGLGGLRHRVLHIMTVEGAEPHAVTSFARIDGARITSPAP